jgi:hypothetical protein
MRHLNGLLIVATLLISTAPLYAQRRQQNVAKLKADARNLVNIFAAHSPTRPALQMADIARLRRRRAASDQPLSASMRKPSV